MKTLTRFSVRLLLEPLCMDQCLIDLRGFDDITGAEIVLGQGKDSCEIGQ